MVTLVLILYFFALVFSVSSQVISGMVSNKMLKGPLKNQIFHFKKTQCKTDFYDLNSHNIETFNQGQHVHIHSVLFSQLYALYQV